MNPKKNKTLVTVVVFFVAFGLVIAYVPLLFTPSHVPSGAYDEPEGVSDGPPATAQLPPPPVLKPEVATTTPTSTEDEVSLPDSFSGLEEENKSLDGILDGF